METLMRLRTLASVVALAGALLALAVGTASADDTPSSQLTAGRLTVPPAIEVPAGNVLIGDFFAKGVQVYQCTSGAWAFVEPAANLLGWALRPSNLATAVHFRGPSWESADDGSLVEARAVANSPVPGSIPQLLLQATRNRGDGAFGQVSYLQRLATRGGAAPTGPCTDGQTIGVPYQARYRFFAPAS
jgi:hypothetical protein